MPKWSNGNLRSDYDKWIPRPTSLSAQFLRVIEMCGGIAPSCFYYDNSMISNLGGNKAGYLVRTGYGCVLTDKGLNYLKNHEIEVGLVHWILYESKLRYTREIEPQIIVEVANLVHRGKISELVTLIRDSKHNWKIWY